MGSEPFQPSAFDGRVRLLLGARQSAEHGHQITVQHLRRIAEYVAAVPSGVGDDYARRSALDLLGKLQIALASVFQPYLTTPAGPRTLATLLGGSPSDFHSKVYFPYQQAFQRSKP